MNLRSDGHRFLTEDEKHQLARLAKMRSALVCTVEVDDGPHRSVFPCTSALEAERAVSLHVKEPGTMAWLDAHLGLGDRFLDFGANIGVYSVAAAHRVGATGQVWAVEPHGPTARQLLATITANRLTDRITVMPFPMSDKLAVGRFHYEGLGTGRSGSQFGTTTRANRGSFDPVAGELVLATSVDDLIARDAMPPPHVIKIDVDGLEPLIVSGMRWLLTSRGRPRSVQVELNVGDEATGALMAEAGYRVAQIHRSPEWERRIAAGTLEIQVPRNAIYVPA